MFKVRVIGNDALPARQDWAMVELDGKLTLFVKRSAMGPPVMAEAYAALRQLRGAALVGTFIASGALELTGDLLQR